MSDGVSPPARPSTEPRQLDARDHRALDAVVALHAQMLGTGPIALLGTGFMRDFYYRRLVEGKIVQCFVAYDGDTPVGFIASTAEPELGAAILRRYPISFALALAKAVLASPRRFKVIWTLLRFSRVRGHDADDGHQPAGAEASEHAKQHDPSAREPNERSGELISLGVLPDYTTRKYLARTKRRHSLELLRAALEGLRAAGVSHYHGFVERKNQPMLFVYQGLGCALIPVAGMPTMRVEGRIDDALAQLPPRVGDRDT